MVYSSEVVLTGFQPRRPKYESSQEHGLEWLSAAHAVAEKLKSNESEFQVDDFRNQMHRFFMRFGCGPDKIKKRGHELQDFLHFDWKNMEIFKLNEMPSGLGVESRMAFYKSRVDEVFNDFYPDQQQSPTDIVHVTCTGYVAPSPPQVLVSSRGWSESVNIGQVYHMGCYAALSAVRVGHGFVSSSLLNSEKARKVDIVHTELCTLHVNPLFHSPEQLVVQSLFADGFIKYSMQPRTACMDEKGFLLLAQSDELVPDSTEDMSWGIHPWGFQMSLSKKVPTRIGAALPAYLERLFTKAGLPFETAKEQTTFAIHPGGPKIIESVRELLQLTEEQVACSKMVLREYGNMSSATLPHVWYHILNDQEIPSGKLIVSLAFGPGLTICGSLMRKL